MLHEPDGRAGRNIALALRDLRKAAGLSGQRLALKTQLSQSKISRIESGRTLPTVADTERILTALAVPREVARDLLDAARVANLDYASWRSVARLGIWHKQQELKALTEDALVVRQFLPAIPSGLIQAEEYARETLTPTVEGRPDRDVDRALAARLSSQAMLDDPGRRFSFILTEQAVRWKRAEPAAMTAQLQHLAKVAERPNVDLAILPLEATVKVSALNVFVVFDDRLVLVETFGGELALRDPRDVAYHLNLFEYFYDRALTGEDARARITQQLD